MTTIRAAVASDAGEVLTVQRAELEWQCAVVAVDDRRIVGIVRAYQEIDVWHIGRLGVVPDRQGAGIGSRLLIHLRKDR